MNDELVEVALHNKSRDGSPSRKGCVVNGQTATVRQATNESTPPPSLPPTPRFAPSLRCFLSCWALGQPPALRSWHLLCVGRGDSVVGVLIMPKRHVFQRIRTVFVGSLRGMPGWVLLRRRRCDYLIRYAVLCYAMICAMI